MTYKVVRAPLAQGEMARFAAYAADYSDDWAIEQFTRLNRVLSVDLAEAPYQWSYFYLTGAPFFISLFTTDPETLKAGAMALRIISAGYIFYGYGMILSQALNGAGDTRTPTLLNFICFWLIEMPLGYCLALYLGWGQAGVYYSIVIAESVLALSAIWVFRWGKWKTVQV